MLLLEISFTVVIALNQNVLIFAINDLYTTFDGNKIHSYISLEALVHIFS